MRKASDFCTNVIPVKNIKSQNNTTEKVIRLSNVDSDGRYMQLPCLEVNWRPLENKSIAQQGADCLHSLSSAASAAKEPGALFRISLSRDLRVLSY